MSIKQVKEFHDKFGVGVETTGKGKYVLTEEAAAFRNKFHVEEANEFREAWEEGDVVKMFDSLLDLAYVVYGTALMMGITPNQWKDGFDHVHRKNMLKRRAASADESKRGSALDVVKPEGWVGPEHGLRVILFGSDAL